MKTDRRMEPYERHREILKAAVAQAKLKGLDTLSLRTVATRAKVTHGLVLHYFGSVKKLRRAVMDAAIEQRILKIVAYGLALNIIKHKDLKSDLREEVIEYMTQGE